MNGMKFAGIGLGHYLHIIKVPLSLMVLIHLAFVFVIRSSIVNALMQLVWMFTVPILIPIYVGWRTFRDRKKLSAGACAGAILGLVFGVLAVLTGFLKGSIVPVGTAYSASPSDPMSAFAYGAAGMVFFILIAIPLYFAFISAVGAALKKYTDF